MRYPGIQHVTGRRWNSYSSYLAIPLERGRPLESETLHGSSTIGSVKLFVMKKAPEHPPPHCNMGNTAQDRPKQGPTLDTV